MAGRPVGITVARKRHEAIHQQEQQRPGAAEPASDDGSFTWEEGPERPTGWRVFLEGSLIYLGCVFFPSLLGFLYRLYTDYQEAQKQELDKTLAMPSDERTNLDSYLQSAYDLWTFAKEETESYLCTSSSDIGVSQSWADYAGISWLCPSDQDQDKHNFLWSPDAQWTDLGTVAFLSLALATVRILILCGTVPLQEPNRLSAVIRCKSVHLLSRDYHLTPHGTPVTKRKLAAADLSGTELAGLQLPSMGAEGDVSQLGLMLDEDGEESNLSSPPRRSPDATDFPQDQEHGNSIQINDRIEGFNSAPRLATALFRLVYSGLVAGVAFYYFATSDFWPVLVGGTGHTLASWDLSGGLSGGIDGDFDAQNTALRKYYLCQSAYHWHSGAFHLLSVLLLFLRPREKRPGWIQDSTSSYHRSFLQHSVAILLLWTTYLFSSLRRLGTIGMFSFDVSSFFLHLLQVCMNSPKTSFLQNARLIAFVYRILVLPSFFYCRFVVWPSLWWSAIAESGNWLQQLDRILFPGSSLFLQTLWHVCMSGAMVLNLVYLRRLWNHPHLGRIIRSRKLHRD